MTTAKRVSVKGAATKATAQDKKMREKLGNPMLSAGTADSFVNYSQRFGVGSDNPLGSSGYGFNPITRVRQTLEWIHRGSWLGGVAVDVVADDMTRGGAHISSEIDPEDEHKIDELFTALKVWGKLNENCKWARLYGGSIAVIMIDGQDPSTPLRLDTISKGQFKGLMVLDRWMVEPSLNNLVTELGPELGQPKYYAVTADAPALPKQKIHYSRVIRQEGIKLPYWQALQENLWGISVLERMYDRMIGFDSAATGAAQLVYKAYIRTYKVKDLRSIVAGGGPAMKGLQAYIDLMRRFQGLEGITVMDGEDEFEGIAANAFGGLAEVMREFKEQLSGALQIPLVRLFGQSPSGFSPGDADLRLYFDGVKQKQNEDLLVGLTKIYRVAAASLEIELDEGFAIKFNDLYEMTDKERAEYAETATRAVTGVHEAALISDKTALMELKGISDLTGIFSNISNDDIAAASDDIMPPDPMGMNGEGGENPAQPFKPLKEAAPINGFSAAGKKDGDQKDPAKKDDPAPSKDSLPSTIALHSAHGISAVIENPKGSIRKGNIGKPDAWQVSMPADYGYINRVTGADNDQLDCYIGPNPGSGLVTIIDQRSLKTGEFDEHKCMLGFDTVADAVQCYHDGYWDGTGPARMMGYVVMSMDMFKRWMEQGDLTVPAGMHE